MSGVPTGFHDLFEKRTVAHFATVTPDGFPHVTPVWVDYDADRDHLLVNTARGRRKERNVRRNPQVGASMVDPDDPYRFVSVQGTVEAVTEEGAVAHINALARRYMGVEEYPNLGEESDARVLVRVRPERVVTS